MTQISPDAWCARLQGKLMVGLDAAFAMMEQTDDLAVMRKAREKARACAQMAATARQILRMVVPRRPGDLLAAAQEHAPQLEAAPPRPERAIDRLKGGRRGRL